MDRTKYFDTIIMLNIEVCNCKLNKCTNFEGAIHSWKLGYAPLSSGICEGKKSMQMKRKSSTHCKFNVFSWKMCCINQVSMHLHALAKDSID